MATAAKKSIAGEAGTRNVTVRLGREVCGTLEIAEQREWLVTNGIGGFASGTVSGNATRRYHGLLVATLKPPVGRTQLVAQIEESCDMARNRIRWQRTAGPAEPLSRKAI